jgi:hypothetical protein
LVPWALGPLGTWSLGHLVPWALGPLGTWSLGHLFHWALSPLGTWSLGHLVPLTIALVLWALGSLGTWSTAQLVSRYLKVTGPLCTESTFTYHRASGKSESFVPLGTFVAANRPRKLFKETIFSTAIRQFLAAISVLKVLIAL